MGLDQRGWQDLAALLEHTLAAVAADPRRRRRFPCQPQEPAERRARPSTPRSALELLPTPQDHPDLDSGLLPALRLAFPEPLLTATQTSRCCAAFPRWSVTAARSGQAIRCPRVADRPVPSLLPPGARCRPARRRPITGRLGLARAVGASACPVCWVCRCGALKLPADVAWRALRRLGATRVARLPGAESLERLECGRLVGDVLECPCCGLDLGERRLASLDAEAREPPQRGALEPIRLGLVNDDADGERVTQVDVRQLARGAADNGAICARRQAPAGSERMPILELVTNVCSRWSCRRWSKWVSLACTSDDRSVG